MDLDTKETKDSEINVLSDEEKATLQSELDQKNKLAELEKLKEENEKYKGVDVDLYNKQNMFFLEKCKEKLKDAPSIIKNRWKGKEIDNPMMAFQQIESQIKDANEFIEQEFAKREKAKVEKAKENENKRNKHFLVDFQDLPDPQTPISDKIEDFPKVINTFAFDFDKSRMAGPNFLAEYRSAMQQKNKPK